MSNIPVVSLVASASGTGKTTFMEKLIKELTVRGYRVGTIKSDAHGFELDKPGKDTWRFAQAGAIATAIIGPNRFALIHETEQKKDLDAIVNMIENVDIILVEGYKMSDKLRIEVVRREKGTTIVSPSEYLIAIVTDVEELKATVPIYDINDYVGIADLIIAQYLT